MADQPCGAEPVREILSPIVARATLLAWAQSGGFAAVHNQGATDVAIVDDLLVWLARHEMALCRAPTAGGRY